MTLSLPAVETVALDLRPESDLRSSNIDVSNDYGTPNLLFLYYVPFIPDDKKLDLDSIQDEFQTWNAWELGQAETQLIGHVKAGDLPSDDSIASRVTRNNYRSKAVSFFRANSQAWLSVANVSTAQKTVETTPDAVNGAILHELRSLATEHQLQDQFRVVLNVINGSIDMEQDTNFYFTHVHYKYDSSSRRFLPVVLDTTFTIKKQESGGTGSRDVFTVKVDLSTIVYNFNRSFWRDHRHKGEDAIKIGEPIRTQMTLDFYTNS